ncbi:MAG: LexA family transcriptional regulator [Xylophilus ampelinus]
MTTPERSAFGHRLLQARKHARLTQVQLARAVGMAQGTLAEAEKTASGSSYTAQLAAATGVRPAWLASGEGDMLAGKSSEPVQIDLENHPDVQAIRTVRLRLRAGIHGFSVDVDQDAGPPIFLPAEWLNKRGLKPEHMLGLPVHGDSMEPTLYDGDQVVINTASTEPRDGKIFAINYEGEAVIKRLVRDAGRWWLSSDNADQRRFARKLCGEASCLLLGELVFRQSERF